MNSYVKRPREPTPRPVVPHEQLTSVPAHSPLPEKSARYLLGLGYDLPGLKARLASANATSSTTEQDESRGSVIEFNIPTNRYRGGAKDRFDSSLYESNSVPSVEELEKTQKDHDGNEVRPIDHFDDGAVSSRGLGARDGKLERAVKSGNDSTTQSMHQVVELQRSSQQKQVFETDPGSLDTAVSHADSRDEYKSSRRQSMLQINDDVFGVSAALGGCGRGFGSADEMEVDTKQFRANHQQEILNDYRQREEAQRAAQEIPYPQDQQLGTAETRKALSMPSPMRMPVPGLMVPRIQAAALNNTGESAMQDHSVLDQSVQTGELVSNSRPASLPQDHDEHLRAATSIAMRDSAAAVTTTQGQRMENAQPSLHRTSHGLFNERDDSDPPAKSSAELDYATDVLFSMHFKQLQDEPFDRLNADRPSVLPVDKLSSHLSEQLEAVAKLHASERTEFLGSLGIEDWTHAGAWLIGRLQDVTAQLNASRKQRRHITRLYEEEVVRRHGEVLEEHQDLDNEINDMRNKGASMISTPRSGKRKT